MSAHALHQGSTETVPAPVDSQVDYQTEPDRYAHLKLDFDGAIARITIDVQEDRGIRPGYKLKLNSYDLGVDIELHDAVQRIRFEHPEVRCVIITSGKDRIFCSGANIFMLGLSSHAWKVNFCKFTNETRNGIEDASRNSGLKFIAACNGTTAGGGYELALACDEIFLVDDRSSAVSLPEVPLLGVLARNRWADAAYRQAQGEARPRRYFLHHDRRSSRRTRQGVATGRCCRQIAAVRCRGQATRA